jgi:transglutaminase-like putative cysteine protease
MPKYRVVHNNHYSFQTAVNSGSFEARLRPIDSQFQQVDFSQFVLRPLAYQQTVRHDEFGNHVNHFEVSQNLRSFKLSAIHTVTTLPRPKINLNQSQPWEQIACGIEDSDEIIKYQPKTTGFNVYTRNNQALLDYTVASFVPDRPILDATHHLMQRIYEDFKYDSAATDVTTTAIDAFQLKRGVCQDFSHIAIACLQSLGLPVRYVSGYLDTHSASPGGSRVAPANTSHAWFSVFDVQFGWVDFDPTNDCMPGEKYITLAYGRDYDDIAPLSGQVDSAGRNQLEVRVELTIIT